MRRLVLACSLVCLHLSAAEGALLAANSGRIELKGAWTDQAGAEFTTARLRERHSMIVLAYSDCPTFCPMTASQVRRLDDAMRARKHDVGIVLVAIDPERETAETLRRWMKKQKVDRKNWHFIKGSREATHELASALSMGFSDQASPTHIAHTNRIALIAPDGTIRVSADLNDPKLHEKIEAALRSGEQQFAR